MIPSFPSSFVLHYTVHRNPRVDARIATCSDVCRGLNCSAPADRDNGFRDRSAAACSVARDTACVLWKDRRAIIAADRNDC